MKNMYEVMKNMKTGIVWRLCMKLWRMWRHELYEEYVWSYDEYEDRNCMKKYVWSFDEYEDWNCMKNMYEVMMNMMIWVVWRISMKLRRIW